MIIKVLKTESEYERALAEAEGLIRRELSAEEAEELELLSLPIEAYEKKTPP